MTPRPRQRPITTTAFSARLLNLIGSVTYAAFERDCGLSRNSINDIIKQHKDPSREKLELIIKGTGCNARWLITGEGEPFGDEKSPPEHSEGHEIPSLSTTPHLKAHETAGLLLASVAAILASIGRGDVSPNLGQQVLEQALDAIREALQSPPGDEAGFDAVRESLSRASSDS